MRISTRRSFSVVVAVVVLSACSGNVVPRSSNDVPANALPEAPKAGRKATLVITLPGILPANAPISWTSRPTLLSAATKSVTGSIGNRSFGPIVLDGTNPRCVSSGASAPLQCTIVVKARVGQSQTLTLHTYAAAGVTKKALAHLTETIDVHPGKNFVTTPALYGIAQRLFAKAVPDVVQQGQWALVAIVVYGKDAAQAMIPSVAVQTPAGTFVKNLKIGYSGFVTGTDCVGEESCGAPQCCGVTPYVFFEYDGGESGTESIVTTAKSYGPTTTYLRAIAGPSQMASILVTGPPDNRWPERQIFQWILGTNGNVAPVRKLAPYGGGLPFAEDPTGNYWLGVTHYSNTGAALGTISPTVGDPSARDANGNLYAVYHPTIHGPIGTCEIARYAAGHYGAISPDRVIDCASVVGATASTGNLAVDAAGDIYLPMQNYGASSASRYVKIFEFAYNSGSGSVAPTRTITLPNTYVGAVIAGTDSAGNLYVAAQKTLDQGNDLLEYAPNSTTAQQILSGVTVEAAAVDESGNVFVVDSHADVEEFPAGSNAPSSVISNTGLNIGTGIAITVPQP